MKQVHGHEVLKMMISSGKPYTRAGLTEEIARQFGADTRFCTCSAENLTAAELVEFLDSRGKFLHQSDGFRTVPDLMCNH